MYRVTPTRVRLGAPTLEYLAPLLDESHRNAATKKRLVGAPRDRAAVRSDTRARADDQPRQHGPRVDQPITMPGAERARIPTEKLVRYAWPS